VLAFAGRYDYRVDLGPRDDFPIVGRAELRSHLLREFLGIGADEIGDREKVDRGMLGGKPCSQRADAAGTYDRDSKLFAFDDFPPAGIFSYCLRSTRGMRNGCTRGQPIAEFGPAVQ